MRCRALAGDNETLVVGASQMIICAPSILIAARQNARDQKDRKTRRRRRARRHQLRSSAGSRSFARARMKLPNVARSFVDRSSGSDGSIRARAHEYVAL